MIEIRKASARDRVAIRSVNQLAFGRDSEADLVDHLQDQGLVIASLVAVAERQVVGTITFSRILIRTLSSEFVVASLAPVAVLPQWQRQGIGSALVEKGIAISRWLGTPAAFVLGHPEFYRRFSFSAEVARKFNSPYSGDSFMALELSPGALLNLTGDVIYSPPFSQMTSGETQNEPTSRNRTN